MMSQWLGPYFTAALMFACKAACKGARKTAVTVAVTGYAAFSL